MQRLDTRRHLPAICACGAHHTADLNCRSCGAPNPDSERLQDRWRHVNHQRAKARQRAAQYQNRSA
jgi:hypothetical protein